MSKDGEWADNTLIKAISEALEVEIYIILNHNYVPNFTLLNHSEIIFLDHLAGLHYISTSSKEEIQQLRYGGFTSDGVALNNTPAIDTCLTWCFNLLSTLCPVERKHKEKAKHLCES